MDNKAQVTQFKILFTAIGSIVIIGLLQYRYSYHLFFLEQLQLFLSGKEYAKGLLSLPGGLIEYLGEYCVQFFNINYIGSVYVAFFLILIGLILHQLLKSKKDIVPFLFLFESGILFFLFIDLLDINFYLKGIIGYLLCVTTLLVYRQIQKYSFLIRLLCGISFASLLFWVGAPFQTLFLVTVSAIELREHGLNKGKSLVPLLVAGIGAGFASLFLGEGFYRMYIDVDGICSMRIVPGWTKYAPWVLLPVAVLLNPLLGRMLKSIKKQYITMIIQSLLVIIGIVYLLPKYDDGWSLPFKQLHHYASQDKWDDILDYCKKHDLGSDYASLNYQNLALAEKGILADSLLSYSQKGKYGLYAPWDRNVPTAFAIQKVCYFYGDIAFAQKYAFEGNVNSVTMGFPETMKTLIRTNLLKKEYCVAAKYIHYLKQTRSYKAWADKQCRYLTDSAAMEDDPEYKGKQLYLEKENHFAFSNELHILSGLNKEDKKLRDFVLCSFLLDKDLKSFLNWFDFYYKDVDLGEVPTLYYQALIACAPSVPDVLTRYDIPESVKEDFEMYTLVYSSGRSAEERHRWLSSQYKNSYWYYIHYTKVDYE